MVSKKQFSIKTRLLFLVLGILIPMSLGSLYSNLRLSHYSEETLKETFTQYAKGLNSSIAAQFFERYGDVQAFAVNQAVQTMDENTMTEYLDAYVTLYGIYDLILVVDKNGKYVASNNHDVAGKLVNKAELRQKSFAEAPWFQAAINQRFTEDASKGFKGTYIEDFLYDPLQKVAFGEDRTASSFTSLIKNKKGEVLGVITNRAGSRWFENELTKLYDDLKKQGLTSTEFLLINKDGFTLTEYDPSVKGSTMQDPQITLKKNIFAENHGATPFLREGKSGYLVTEHTRKKIKQIVGYSFNNDPKFISQLGWSILIRESQDVAFKNATEIMFSTYIILAVIASLSLAGAFWFANGLSSNIASITEQVAAASGLVSAASEELSKSSSDLSNAAQSQAQSIETTSASLEEISGMINLNVKSAEKANDISLEVKEFTHETQKSVSNLSNAMSEILESNHRIEKLVKIIEQIGDKTEVIDEIVFKTQLLSFNASVEAERAGEHGRGFAVVAQEVGNLAQMSGVAAMEISNIVKNSIKEAESVAVENKERVENGGQLVSVTQEKMKHVIEKMSEIYESTEQILTASREQSVGIKQISSSVESLSQTTQQTASGAEEASSSSTELASQAERLMSLVDQMKSLVLGGGENGSHAQVHSLQERKNKANSASSSEHTYSSGSGGGWHSTTEDHHQVKRRSAA